MLTIKSLTIHYNKKEYSIDFVCEPEEIESENMIRHGYEFNYSIDDSMIKYYDEKSDFTIEVTHPALKDKLLYLCEEIHEGEITEKVIEYLIDIL